MAAQAARLPEVFREACRLEVCHEVDLADRAGVSLQKNVWPIAKKIPKNARVLVRHRVLKTAAEEEDLVPRQALKDRCRQKECLRV